MELKVSPFPQLDAEPVSRLIQRMNANPSLSYRFKNALTAFLAADPVDAARDAELLAYVMDRRAQTALAAATVFAQIHQTTQEKK